jgi:restriction system protein
MPSYLQLMNPVLRAIRELGGSASVDEIKEKVAELEHIPEEVTAQLHDPDKSNMTEVGYRLAWARTYLKKFGLLDNSARGVWSLSAAARSVEQVDPAEVDRKVRATSRESSSGQSTARESVVVGEEEPGWKSELHLLLTKDLAPSAFERLVQRVLRESGFSQVEVTGRSGDGGIDGRGIARIHGLMSFHVLFQCKRYKGSVGAAEVRDFRGAMVGRADKGLFVTTGTFSPGAVKEATRDGTPPIDLVDGDELAEKLKSLRLGIRTETIEVVEVDQKWFECV